MSQRPQRKNVLLIAYLNSHLPELRRVARCLLQSGRFQPILLYAGEEDSMQPRLHRQWIDAGIRVIGRSGHPLPVFSETNHSQPQKNIANVLRQFLLTRATHSPPLKKFLDWAYRSVRTLTFLSRTLKYRQFAERMLREFNLHLIILTEENVGYQTALYVHAARSQGCGSIVVPYTIANATEAAEHALDNRRLWVRGPFRTWLSRRFPHWVYEYQGRRLFLLPPFALLITEWLKLAPPDPWMLNSGDADAIAVESEAMMTYYLDNRIPQHRLVLTGSVADDELSQTLANASLARQSLNARTGLDPKKPLLLCAIPPPWFPRPACGFPDYRSLIDFWMGALRELKRYTIAIHLHPRISAVDAGYITQAGFPLVSEDLPTLIPLADIYLASISATIRWAIACGKPVLNYDVYKYRFHDYAGAQGVVTVEDSKDFQQLLQRVETDVQFVSELTETQRKVQNQWGMLDGHSQQRLLSLFERMSSHPKKLKI